MGGVTSRGAGCRRRKGFGPTRAREGVLTATNMPEQSNFHRMAPATINNGVSHAAVVAAFRSAEPPLGPLESVLLVLPSDKCPPTAFLSLIM